ncbi:hypothetical protein AMQ83_35690 [Paenibacillus riograndensis]|nr:hypothetical protein AMQ83_35690 [Paenibacillus riograndensis]
MIHLQTVAHAAHRYDAEIFGILLELVAQTFDMRVHGAFIPIESVTPDVADQHVARKNLPGITGQFVKQLKFF